MHRRVEPHRRTSEYTRPASAVANGLASAMVVDEHVGIKHAGAVVDGE
jgi:hypothetical protein